MASGAGWRVLGTAAAAEATSFADCPLSSVAALCDILALSDAESLAAAFFYVFSWRPFTIDISHLIGSVLKGGLG